MGGGRQRSEKECAAVAEDLQALAMYMAKLNATYERDGFPRDEHA